MADRACPSDEELAAFAVAGLSPARRADLERHLAGCEDCSTMIAALIDDSGPLAPGDDGLDASAPRRYQLLRLLGTGGMGTVFEAQEVQADRRVALKLANEREGEEGAQVLRRFFREARIAALLEHPNIVPVFDVGEFPDGTPYYTQRLIVGRSLTQVIAACAVLRERIALLRHFREMCDAVAYAHARGVIHRDIKSANAIVGDSGETWIIDWGLARVRGVLGAPADEAGLEPEPLADEPLLTQVGSALGTPAYMSPEQARGNIELVGERSDVWSLGAVLLEILSGRQPFAGATAEEVLRKLRAGEGPSLSGLRAREVPLELAAIATQALSIDPAKRYPSAVELAAEVHRWMIGRPVSAYRYSPLQRMRLWVRSHKTLSAAAAVALTVGAAWAFSLRAAFTQLRGQRTEDLVLRGEHSIANMQWDRAAADFALALELQDRRDARLGLAAVGESAPRPLWLLPAQVGVLRAIAFADGQTVVATGDDNEAAAFDLQSGAELARLRLEGPGVAAAGCGGLVALASGSAVQLWRPRGEVRLGTFAAGSPVRAVALSQDCALLATAAADGVRVFLSSGGELARIPGDVRGVAFDGLSRLIWATPDALYVAPDARAPSSPAVLRQERPVHALSVAAGRALLEFEDGKVSFFDISTQRRLSDSRLSDSLTSIRFQYSTLFPDGRSAVGFGRGFGTWFLDVESGAPFCSIAALSRPLFTVAIAPDGSVFAEGGEDRSLRIYALAGVRTYAGIRPEGSAAARDLAWSPRGMLLASADADGAVRLWDREGPTPRAPLGRHAGGAYRVRFSPDGAMLASVGADGLRLWDVASGRESAGLAGAFRSVAWLSNTALVLGSDSGDLLLRDEHGARRIGGGGAALLSLAASPDGSRIAAGDATGALTLFDLDGAARARVPQAHAEPLFALAFSPDGKTLASGGGDATVRLWDAVSLAPRAELTSYGSGAVNSLEFAPRDSPVEGLLLAAYVEAKTLLWDPETQNALLGVGMQSPLTPASTGAHFSPDGRQFAVLTSVNALRIWPLESRSAGAAERILRLYKYERSGSDVMRDEAALVPPAARAIH